MIAENTIQITNAFDLSVNYLTRFFSKSGEIQKVIKDQNKKTVMIEFKNKRSIQRVLVYNGRVLDKKPISIQRLNQVIPITQKQVGYKQKEKLGSQKLIKYKLPSFHQLNKQDSKLCKRSSYREISNQNDELHFTILLDNNPFQNIQNKSQLWKMIINEMKKNLTINDSDQNQLIMSISMSIWGYIQLKLGQIEYLLIHKENMKSKYVENFIQEIITNKLTLLTNDKLITNSNRFKVHQSHQSLHFAFNVSYPDQTQQEAQFFCETNETVQKFLIAVYQNSHRLGKICHILHTNSLIAYEDTKLLQNLIKNFLYKPSQQLLGQIESSKELQMIENQSSKKGQQKLSQAIKSQSLISFTGQIQNYGCCVFQNLTHKNFNSMIWLQNIPTKVQTDQDYPRYFTLSYIYDQSQGKSINESSFFNLFRVDQKQKTLLKTQSYLFADQVIVFQQGQFSLIDLLENSLSFMRFKIRKLIAQKQEGKLLICKIQKYLSTNQFHRLQLIQSQIQQNSQELNMQNQNYLEKVKILYNLDICYVGIQIQSKHQQIKNCYNSLRNCCNKLQNIFNDSFRQFETQIKFNLILVDMIPTKQKQFNAFKCQNYLINHIDTHIIGKNTIIASEQFAQKVAQKVLQSNDKKQLFGFKDKKYIGSQIWRLYNKSGARRAKLKISEYHYKRLKSQ